MYPGSLAPRQRKQEHKGKAINVQIIDSCPYFFEDEEPSFEEHPEILSIIPDGMPIDDSVCTYLKEIGKVPLLTPAEEVNLAQRKEDSYLGELIEDHDTLTPIDSVSCQSKCLRDYLD